MYSEPKKSKGTLVFFFFGFFFHGAARHLFPPELGHLSIQIDHVSLVDTPARSIWGFW